LLNYTGAGGWNETILGIMRFFLQYGPTPLLWAAILFFGSRAWPRAVFACICGHLLKHRTG